MRASKTVSPFVRLMALALGAALLVGCSSDDGPLGDGPFCSAKDLSARLADAQPGDVISIGSCAVSGEFVVPAGVELVGEGVGQSTLTAEEGQTVLTLMPGSEGATALRNLTVASPGPMGVRAEGSGSVEIESAELRSNHGVSLGVEGLDTLTLRDVVLRGPVTEALADQMLCERNEPEDRIDCQPVTARHGLVAIGVGTITLEQVDAMGFASQALFLVDSDTTWTDGSATDNLFTGVLATGGSLTMENVDLSRALTPGSLEPAIAGTFLDVAVQTTAVTVNNSADFGLVQQGGTARHTDLVAERNENAAVVAQDATEFVLSGAASRLADNKVAGIVVERSAGVSLRDATVTGTREVETIIRGDQNDTVGDGVVVLDPAGETALQALTISDSQRVGLVIDLTNAATAADTMTLSDVTVSGSGDQFGAVMQGIDPPAGWDDGLTREGAVVDNDATLDQVTVLDVSKKLPESFAGVQTAGGAGLAGFYIECD